MEIGEEQQSYIVEPVEDPVKCKELQDADREAKQLAELEEERPAVPA